MADFRKRGKKWYYKFTDADGRRLERRGCADRRVTEEMARAAESEAARTRAGLIDPRDAAFRRHEARPLAAHLADFHAAMLARGRTAKHADLTRNRAARVIELAGAERISDLAPSRAESALAALRRDGRSLETLNHHVRAVKAFSKWLWRDNRARADALAPLSLYNAATDRRHDRRALTADEAARLIQAAEQGPVVRAMTGPDRAMLYRVALGTGFRANELRTLTPGSFRLDGGEPTVIVAAGYSKRRREDSQPIRPDLAAALRRWLADKPDGRPVFATMPALKTAAMIRVDLHAAGIPYRDGAGRVADFHSLRHSFVSHVVQGGASVKVAQTLARHSTPVLTIGRYAHVALHDQAAALDALPDLTPAGPTPEAATLAATGTDGPPVDTRDLAPYLPLPADGSGRELTDAGGIRGTGPEASMGRKTAETSGLGGPGRELAVAGGVGVERRRPDSNRGITDLQSGADSPQRADTAKTSGSTPRRLPRICPTTTVEPPPDLALVVDAWPTLPEAVKASVLMLVKAASGSKGGGR